MSPVISLPFSLFRPLSLISLSLSLNVEMKTFISQNFSSSYLGLAVLSVLSPGRVLVQMNLGVLVTRPPRLLQASALDGEQDDDDGGEEAHDDGRHPDGNEVLLLEPAI